MAVNKVNEARKLMKDVLEATPERQAIRRARFPETVWEAVGNDEREAEQITAFAKTIADSVGRNKALNILKNEYDAPYGRSRRQDAIRRAVLALESDEIVEKFFYLHPASDVDAWILGAIAWLEFQAVLKALKTVGNDDFTEADKRRHFKCGCGC